ncbi:hypothetical protein GWI33_017221 [Rhynchophorus ferrugineus]|uniref:Uncharacterized protein n=1 Tax=Rhynchophorus ferrugineus TaxID=354439 RepID=A0A834HX57_RHYFE|nr:hypothetical protein GWI33_017221 [Rhynchophorus ferrugineus]
MESNYGEVGGWPRFEAKPTLSRRLRTRNLLLSTTPAARWQTGVSLGGGRGGLPFNIRRGNGIESFRVSRLSL